VYFNLKIISFNFETVELMRICDIILVELNGQNVELFEDDDKL